MDIAYIDNIVGPACLGAMIIFVNIFELKDKWASVDLLIEPNVLDFSTIKFQFVIQWKLGKIS